MKTTILLIAATLLSLFSKSQDWSALGDGSGTNNEVLEAIGFQGDLVIAGKFTLAGNQTVNRIARWDGASWHPMGAGFDGDVRALAVYNGELYAAGFFSADGTGTTPFPGMAKWSGSAWVQVPVPDPATYDYRDLYVFNGELYATKHTSNPAFRVQVAKFNGSVWTDLPGEFFGPVNYKYLYALGEYQGKLLAGGVFDSVSGAAAQRVALFNGSTWESMDFPVPGETTPGMLDGKAFAFKEFEDKLFVGGIFPGFAGTTTGVSVASWDGSSWTAHPFDDNVGNIIGDFEIYDDRLIASGELGYWQGTQIVAGCAMFDTTSTNSWTNLAFYNPASTDLSAQDMAIVNGTLYIAGKFSHAGSSTQPVRNVARFNSNLPTNLNDPGPNKDDLTVFPNPAGEILHIVLPESLTGRMNVNYSIVDLSGKEVGHGKLTGTTIGTGHLPAGTYLLKVNDNNGQRMVKFTVL